MWSDDDDGDEAFELANEKVDDFKRRVGFSAAPHRDATDGVKADWRSLPAALRDHVAGLRLEPSEMNPFEPGLSTASWHWRRRGRGIAVEVFVSGLGPTAARKKLLQLATDTSAPTCNLELGPAGLGEIAAQDITGSDDLLLWAFRNVCVQVSNEASGPAILPVAHRLQSFMEAHLVANIARFVPRVTRIDLTPSPIRVGDTFSVTAHLGVPVHPSELLVEFRPADAADLLDWEEDLGLERTFRAREPGRTTLEIHVIDRKSLLSPKAGVVIDVLPAP